MNMTILGIFNDRRSARERRKQEQMRLKMEKYRLKQLKILEEKGLGSSYAADIYRNKELYEALVNSDDSISKNPFMCGM